MKRIVDLSIRQIFAEKYNFFALPIGAAPAAIAQPSLVVIPTRDQLVPALWQYDLASRLANAAVVEVDGARHELPWTHADQLVKALDEFLGSSD